MDEPPLHLLLGSDAVETVGRSDTARMEADRKWRELSVSTDFAQGDPRARPGRGARVDAR